MRIMEIFKIFFDEKWNLNFSLHWSIYCIAIALILFWVFKLLKTKWMFHKNIEIDSAEIGIQGQKIKIKPNYTNIDIAYKIWVELNTRKIGIQIDFENDVITEVYNSWYQFFGITRDLIKDLPATKIRLDSDSKELIEISMKILNEGLRPHLTEWQAKYRRWYNTAIEISANENKSPQQIQKDFPQYDLLKEDMSRINRNLINYKDVIYKLAFGE
mgnify:CR=1 FL=1